ncbi:MAG: hypothetical protein IJI14_15545 [Anaerolineaceae bacterium]|nr:hypothetical protein [Anaerolineaceae bacterium]
MAYTALKEMRKANQKRFRKDIGPMQPALFTNRRKRNDLKSAALRFLHNSCEGLRFDPKMEEQEKHEKKYLGKSLKPGQIPFNMEMDINRLCLEKSLETFIDSGTAEDAYMVYYCFLNIFFGQYGKSKKMVELLSEYESNGSSLLMKHRDHYSHSVYVFALGLAIYETNEQYRKAFKTFYSLDPDEKNKAAAHKAANLFLEFWGLTSLFHDIGYPFELPFEQVLSYFEVDNKKRGKGTLYLAFRSTDTFTALDKKATDRFKTLYETEFHSVSELLAHDITKKLGKAYEFDEAYLQDVIKRKPSQPEDFGYFMDHAFFSAVRLYRELENILKLPNITKEHIDALSAIILHNSMFKFSISFYKDPIEHKMPLPLELHPLAWLLMLCDELQCWDRTAYGRNSRREMHPMAAEFDFSGNALNAVYYYDEEEREKVERFNDEYNEWLANPGASEEPRLKAYSDMAGEKQRFTRDIEKIVDTSIIPLTVTPELRKADRRSKHVYLSDSSFLHLYDFAVALHGRNKPDDTPTSSLEENFNSLSLEYQLSTIGRARYFSRYLDAINCFYTDKPVDLEMVSEFKPHETAVFAPMEHERWIREHQMMGWRYGIDYEMLPLDLPEEKEKSERSALREQTRQHKLVMDGKPDRESIYKHYLSLPKKYQDKDWKPFNSLLKLLKKFDGLRIYRQTSIAPGQHKR